jgi:murein L,D-transpeptidase YafK
VVGVLLLAWAHWPRMPLPVATRAERLVVDKARRRLTVYVGGRPVRSYRVALGKSPLGPKAAQGDQRTPEGSYRIDYRRPDSAFHRALHISYPSPGDREAARLAGVPPGGAIMIHGLRNGWGWLGRLHALRDWTAGCIAVTNQEIEELWRVVPDGTPIEIRP